MANPIGERVRAASVQNRQPLLLNQNRELKLRLQELVET